MKKVLKIVLSISGIAFCIWMCLTLWVESSGPVKKNEFGNASAAYTALVVYDPDPIYNFDQQICESFAKGLGNNKWKVIVATVAAAKKLNQQNIDLYILCANTYNWSPDWSLCRYVETSENMENKNVVAITVGAGSTGRSQRLFEEILYRKKANVIDSKTFWFMRSNDKTSLTESNINVAINMTRAWAKTIAGKMPNSSLSTNY